MDERYGMRDELDLGVREFHTRIGTGDIEGGALMSDSPATAPSAQETGPRTATADDLPRLSETMAAAFHDDPVFTWWIADGDRRRQILPGFFGVVAEANLPDGEVYTEAQGVAAAIWSPPDADDHSEEMLPLLAGLAGEYADRMFEAFELMDERHPTQPHHYLFFLGTRPEWQSRGLGSALMRPVLERCDRDGVPAYLEGTCEDNVRLYLRHGFDVTGTIPLPDGPSLTCMWRDPR